MADANPMGKRKGVRFELGSLDAMGRAMVFNATQRNCKEFEGGRSVSREHMARQIARNGVVENSQQKYLGL